MACAEKKALYVVFPDLTNVFPWTDHGTLWSMMYRKGVGGPIFDWMRMLYRCMSYVVRLGKEVSAPFKTTIGILTGDTTSPGLWTFVLSDIILAAHSEDIMMAGRMVNHMMHADDGAVFSGLKGIVAHLAAYGGYASWKGFIVNVPKTKAMIFGKQPGIRPVLRIQG